MLQLTKALLVAAAVAPAFAAPLEAREPRITGSQVKKVGKALGHVASGVGTAATVSSFFVPQGQGQQRRSVTDDEELSARSPRGGSGHGGGGHMGPREVDIDAREPNFFSTVIKDVGKVAKFVIREDELDARAFEPSTRPFPRLTYKFRPIIGRETTLETREPFIKYHESFAPVFRNKPIFGREVDIEARDPNFFSTVIKDVGKVAKFVIRDDAADRLEAREPRFGGGGHGHFGGHFGGRHAPSGGMEAREESIVAREPGRFHGGGGGYGGHGHHGGGIQGREESIEAREPNFFSTIVKDVGKVAKFVIREDENGDLYARDYSNELYLD